jgi:F-type H+-transporting ATPase subunit gamma
MASLKEFNLKIGSLKSTVKVTSAMKLISATRLKKAQTAIEKAQPYNERLFLMSSQLAGEKLEHPLMYVRPVKHLHALIFTSDRGLCAGFNNNLLKSALVHLKEEKAKGREVTLGCIGRRGRDFMAKRGFTVSKFYPQILKAPNYASAQWISNDLINDFTHNRIDQVLVFYNYFHSPVTQKPTREEILPLKNIPAQKAGTQIHPILEPGRMELMEALVTQAFRLELYRIMLATSAGEHGARMAAMDSATKNAQELIRKYTLRRNRLRQANITKELIEIISGAEAL